MKPLPVISLCVLCVSAVVFIGCGGVEERTKPETETPLISNHQHLITLLGSDDWQTREKATKDLIAIGESIMPQLEKAYYSTKDPEVRMRIRQIANKHGYILDPKLREQVNPWLEQLYSPDGEKRLEAFDKLVEFGRPGIKTLKRVLEGPSPKIEMSLVSEKTTIRIEETTTLKLMVKNNGTTSAWIVIEPREDFPVRGSYMNKLSNYGVGIGRAGRMPVPLPLVILRTFIKGAIVLKPSEVIKFPSNSYFINLGIGIYSYTVSRGYRWDDVILSNIILSEEFPSIRITPHNIITKVRASTTICVLPEDEDLGKNMRITVENQESLREQGEIKVSASFVEGLKPSEDDDKFGLWYILLDKELNPASYGNLTDNVKLPDKLAGAKINFSIKLPQIETPNNESRTTNYALLLGYGNCAFSQLEKIKITE